MLVGKGWDLEMFSSFLQIARGGTVFHFAKGGRNMFPLEYNNPVNVIYRVWSSWGKNCAPFCERRKSCDTDRLTNHSVRGKFLLPPSTHSPPCVGQNANAVFLPQTSNVSGNKDRCRWLALRTHQSRALILDKNSDLRHILRVIR